ncbi:MAG TPA: hypothetical protein VMT70_15715 [Vicinamibacteria bacterium]|nr:hypothetical protein [Vicinamibacteria bacterium]
MMPRMAMLVVGFALAAGGAAWAGTKSHSIDVTLTVPTAVSGHRIPAGDYRLSWVGDSSEVHVTFENDRKVVAQVDAKLERRAERTPDQEVISRTTKNGGQALEEVRLGGGKEALVFTVS